MKKLAVFTSLIALLALTACEGKGVSYEEFHGKAEEQNSAIEADLEAGKLPFTSLTIKGTSYSKIEGLGSMFDGEQNVEVNATLTYKGTDAEDWGDLSKWEGYSALKEEEQNLFKDYAYAHMSELPEMDAEYEQYESTEGVKITGKGVNYYVSNGFKITVDIKVSGQYTDSEKGGNSSVSIQAKGTYNGDKAGWLAKVSSDTHSDIQTEVTVVGVKTTSHIVIDAKENLTITRK